MSRRRGGLGSDIADPGLAEDGLRRIAWAERTMPVLGLLRQEYASEAAVRGRSVAACLHVTAETAVLVGLITAGGRRCHLAASNPLSTQDDIAAALAVSPGFSSARGPGSTGRRTTRTCTGPWTARPTWSWTTAATW